MHVPKQQSNNYTRQKLIEQQEETDASFLRTGDFNTLLSITDKSVERLEDQ